MKRKLLTITIVIVVLVVSLIGCVPDMGDYEDMDAYYECFPYVYFVDRDLLYDVDGVSMSKLFNEDSYSDKSIDEIIQYDKADDYKYMVIPCKKDLSVDTLSVFVNTSDNDTFLYVNVFIVRSFPFTFGSKDDLDILTGTYIYKNGDLQYTFKFDGKGSVVDESSNKMSYTFDEKTLTANYERAGTDKFGEDVTIQYKAVLSEDYSYLTIKESYLYSSGESEQISFGQYYYEEETLNEEGCEVLGTASCSLTTNEWTSFSIDDWYISGEKYSKLDVKDGDFIVVKFLNNCSGNKRKRISRVKFKLTNVMIRGLF